LVKSGPGCIQGYNGQIIVNQDGFILEPLLSNFPVDYRLLQPSYERLKEIAEAKKQFIYWKPFHPGIDPSQ